MSAFDFMDVCQFRVKQEGGRASEGGFLPLTLNAYLKLVDWTGRLIRRDKRGSIPADRAPILDRLPIAGERWLESVTHLGRLDAVLVGQIRDGNLVDQVLFDDRHLVLGAVVLAGLGHGILLEG